MLKLQVLFFLLLLFLVTSCAPQKKLLMIVEEYPKKELLQMQGSYFLHMLFPDQKTSYGTDNVGVAAELLLHEYLAQKKWVKAASQEEADILIFLKIALHGPIAAKEYVVQKKYEKNMFVTYSFSHGKYVLQPNYGFPVYLTQIQSQTFFEQSFAFSFYKTAVLVPQKLPAKKTQNALTNEQTTNRLQLFWRVHLHSVEKSTDYLTVFPEIIKALDSSWREKCDAALEEFCAP